MIAATVAEFGRIDIIVNNAAAPRGADRVAVLDLASDVFKNVVDVKLMGTFYCSKAAAEQMIRQGDGGRIDYGLQPVAAGCKRRHRAL